MPHPDVTIEGNADFQAIPMLDETGRSLLVAVTKATFAYDAAGRLSAAPPAPVSLSPIYHGDPASSSLKLDSDTAFAKLGTDVVVLGHARSHRGPVQSLDAGVRVGPVQRIARVFGDRFWVQESGAAVLTRPQPFEALPLVYERAFGGWDRSDADPRRHLVEKRNPVGVGFGRPLRANGDTLRAPNIVDAQTPVLTYGTVAAPVGFGFVAPHWAPRDALAGTYDEVWEKTRKPLLPADFSRRHFNAASEGLVSAGFLRGDEPVTLVNIGAAARVDFRLPVVEPPLVTLHLRGARETALAGNLDTVVIDADAMLVSLVWRASVPVKDGIQELVAAQVHCNLAVAPAAA